MKKCEAQVDAYKSASNPTRFDTLLRISTTCQQDPIFAHVKEVNKKNAARWFFADTYSLCTKWFRRSCVMSSCQLFLIPVAEGGPAVGMEPTPPPSFIRLEERGEGIVLTAGFL